VQAFSAIFSKNDDKILLMAKKRSLDRSKKIIAKTLAHKEAKEPLSVRSVFLSGWHAYAWLALIAFAIYAQTLGFGIVFSDDNHILVEGKAYLSNPQNLISVFTDRPQLGDVVVPYYRPVFRISYMIDSYLGGFSNFGYHLSNVAAHMIATCLIFYFLLLFGYRRSLSFLATLLFAVHPALTAAVAWIPGRIDIWLTMFLLPSLFFFLKYLEDRKLPYLIAHSLFFMVSLFTKEIAALSCLIFPLFVFLIRKENPLKKENLIIPAVWIPMLAVWLFMRSIAMQTAKEVAFSQLPLQILQSIPVLFNHLGKMIIPANLTVLQMARDSSPVIGIISALVVALLLFFSKEKRWNYVLFGLAWFLFFMVPAIPVPEIIEHRNYITFIGVMIVLLEIDWIKNINLRSNVSIGIITALVITFSGVNITYSRKYTGELPYWLDVVKSSPNHPLALVEAGVALFNNGNKPLAEEYLNEAVKKKPPLVSAHLNLGKIAAQRGDLDLAEKEFKLENTVKQNFEASFSLGEINIRRKNWAESEKYFTDAMKIKPMAPDVHLNLSYIYSSQGLLDKAEEELKKELSINPSSDRAYSAMGFVYANRGSMKEAAVYWRQAILYNPNNMDAYNNLARYYFIQKDYFNAGFYLDEVARRGGTPDPQILRAIQGK
jgi:protein O-mannosyl-transferase